MTPLLRKIFVREASYGARSVIRVGVAWLLLVSLCIAAPLDIGSRRELFVDDFLVDRMENLSFEFHTPRKAEVVFEFNAPWEGSSSAYVTIFKDGSFYRMYYRAVEGNAPASGEGWVMNTCYAMSEDGIRWKRPHLGLYEFKGSKENNIVWPGKGPGRWDTPVSNFAVFRDTNPDCPPSERYKALGGTFGFAHAGYLLGYQGFVSSDGVRWRQLDGYLIDKRHWPEHSDEASIPVFWSEYEKQYVAFIRVRVDDKLQPMDSWNPKSIRWFAKTTSKDFRNWTPLVKLDYGDAPIEHFYTVAVVPYFRAPHHYIGLPMRILPERTAKIAGFAGEAIGTGMTDTVLITSRNGVDFTRRFLESYIRPGRDRLNWTDRNTMAATGVVETGLDEISLYITEHHRLPTNRVRRCVLRPDGFVSVRASYAGGELVTKPIRFRGKKLNLNVSTSAAGGVRVEMLDANSEPIPGFAFKDAIELVGDSTDQGVAWRVVTT